MNCGRNFRGKAHKVCNYVRKYCSPRCQHADLAAQAKVRRMASGTKYRAPAGRSSKQPIEDAGMLINLAETQPLTPRQSARRCGSGRSLTQSPPLVTRRN